jgi:hypothetical protein
MSETPSWRDSLSDDLKSDPNLVKFNDVTSLAKSYKELSSKIGGKAYDVPKDDWKPEQWNEWHKTIGVPETPDKYPGVDAAVLEKVGLTSESLAEANKKFHEMGLTPRQVKNLNEWYFGNLNTQIETDTQAKARASEEATAKLKQEYGDKFPAKFELARSVVNLGGKEFGERIANAGFGNDPELFKMFVSLGEKLMEDSSRRGGSSTAQGTPKQAALNEISELKGNKEYMTRFTSGDKEAVKKWNDLHTVAYAA